MKYQWKIGDEVSEWHEVELTADERLYIKPLTYNIDIGDKLGIEPVKVSKGKTIQILVSDCEDASFDVYNAINGLLYDENDIPKGNEAYKLADNDQDGS